jgi:outer membrane protein assembly factor BamB
VLADTVSNLSACPFPAARIPPVIARLCSALPLAVLLCVPSIPTQKTVAADWPQFRGPLGNGHAVGANVPAEWSEAKNVAWKTPVPGEGHSSPVVAGDQVWLTTSVVETLSAAEQKKRLAIEPNPNGLEIAAGVSLRALCFDANTGELLRDIEVFTVEKPGPVHSLNSYASPTPVVEEGRVYIHFGTYGTACLDRHTGAMLWEQRSLKIDHQNGPGASPILWKDFLIAQYDGIDRQFVAALDKHTGQVAWQVKRAAPMPMKEEFRKAYATPHVVDVNGQPTLISPGADWVYGYDPATGSELWRINYGQLGFSTVPRPVVGHGLAFIVTSFVQSRLLAVKYDGRGDVTDSHVVWTSDRQVPKKPSLLLVGDELYLLNDGGILTCLDARTGEEHWRHRLGGQYSASPLYAAGRIYVFSQEGKATVIAPGTEYQELAQNELEAGFMASPAVTGDALILRTETHLYRIEE